MQWDAKSCWEDFKISRRFHHHVYVMFTVCVSVKVYVPTTIFKLPVHFADLAIVEVHRSPFSHKIQRTNFVSLSVNYGKRWNTKQAVWPCLL